MENVKFFDWVESVLKCDVGDSFLMVFGEKEIKTAINLKQWAGKLNLKMKTSTLQ